MPVTSYEEARKQNAGWRHILGLYWNGGTVDWNDKILDWGVLERKISRGSEGFISGLDSLKISDTDRAIWGSFRGANGTNPHWSFFEVTSALGGPDGTFTFGSAGTAKFGMFRFGELRFGEQSIKSSVKRGRVIGFSAQESEINIDLYDQIEVMNNAKFVWDFANLYATDSSGRPFGTIHNIIGGSIVIIEDPADRIVAGSFYGRGGIRRTQKRVWDTLGKLGIVGTDMVVPGDVIKFSTSNITSDSGATLADRIGYSVVSGSFYISSNGSTAFGTIVLSQQVSDIGRGDFIYLRKPLVFEGNPGTIIERMMTGSNTNIGFPLGSLASEHFTAAKAVCGPMYLRKEIEDTSAGAVLKEIKEITQLLDGVYFFNKNGQFVWMPARPRMRDNIDMLADYYDAIANGTGNIWDFTYKEQTSSIITDARVTYNSQSFDEITGVNFGAEVNRYNVDVSNYNNGFRNLREVHSSWMTDQNEAVITADRILSRFATAAKEITFNTSLYGLEEEPYRLLNIAHRTGSLDAGEMFNLDSARMNFSQDIITLSLRNINKDYFGNGWGYYTDGSISTHAVSGTSRCGWGWPDSEGNARHGSIHAIIASAANFSTLVLEDVNGGIVPIGTDGFSIYISVGLEIMKILNGTWTTSTFTVQRAVETTNLNATLSAGDGFTIWPCEQDASKGTNRPIYPHGGTNPNSNALYPGAYGTVLNINVGSYGTVWRWW